MRELSTAEAALRDFYNTQGDYELDEDDVAYESRKAMEAANRKKDDEVMADIANFGTF